MKLGNQNGKLEFKLSIRQMLELETNCLLRLILLAQFLNFTTDGNTYSNWAVINLVFNLYTHLTVQVAFCFLFALPPNRNNNCKQMMDKRTCAKLPPVYLINKAVVAVAAAYPWQTHIC